MNKYLLKTMKDVWSKKHYQKVYLKWKDYHKVYNNHWYSHFNVEYFTTRNGWNIKWKYIDESKIFTSADLYYIRQNKC